jgi:hypothetical protein
MKGLGFSPRPENANTRRAHRPEASPGGHIREPIVGGPRLGDVAFEIGVMLALHLAVAFAVVMTLRSYGIA